MDFFGSKFLPAFKRRKLAIIGLVLILLAFLPVIATFYSVIWQEIAFSLRTKPQDAVISYENVSNKTDPKVVSPLSPTIVPVDLDFSIVIPRINANSKIIENVDPEVTALYQKALTKGVAHAAGSSTPDKLGNVFLFAHSSDNFINANRYNSVFYLLHHLEKGDFFYITYKKLTYKYLVTEKKVVFPDAVEYLKGDPQKYMATLMTCWPAGTTLNRLVVVGEYVK